MKGPTMKEVLELVDFYPNGNGDWCVLNVNADVMNSVRGDVGGTVNGTINGKEWTLVESPKEKIIRMIREGKGEQAIDMIELTGIFGD